MSHAWDAAAEVPFRGTQTTTGHTPRPTGEPHKPRSRVSDAEYCLRVRETTGAREASGMATGTVGTKPVQFRLPAWAREFLDEQARQSGSTKTEIVLEALECLREKELAALMAEGYRELADLNEELAEESMGIAGETLPEWD